MEPKQILSDIFQSILSPVGIQRRVVDVSHLATSLAFDFVREMQFYFLIRQQEDSL